MAGVCVALFALLALLVQSRLLGAADLAVLSGVQSVHNCSLVALSNWASLLFAGEVCVGLSVVLMGVLWRLGFGARALVVWVLYGTLLVEFGLKVWLNQPDPGVALPATWVHACPQPHYPFLGVDLGRSFPSGYAVRMAFFLMLPLLVLLPVRARMAWVYGAAMVLLMVFLIWTRLYLEWHWTTDLIAGVLLGGAVAFGCAAVLLTGRGE